jgi:hypothetical protein
MTSTAPRSRGRHRTDLLSLLFGVFFLAAALWWAAVHYLDWKIDWNLPRLGWFAAGGLILLGLLGVAASFRRDRAEIPVSDGPATKAPGSADPGARSEPPTQPEPRPAPSDADPTE